MNIGLSARSAAHAATLALVVAALLPVGTAKADPLFSGGKKDARSVTTDAYEMDVQKNGGIRIRDVNGETIFENVMPTVTLEGEDTAHALKVVATQTERFQAHDRLGDGQGMTYSSKDCEWFLATYPGKPYISAHVTYHNKGKKPVRVSRLSPWSIGTANSGRLVLGTQTAETRLLDNGTLFRSFNDYADAHKGKTTAQWNLAAYNPVSGKSLVAGFLSYRAAHGQIMIERSEKAAADCFDRFSADCVYDPPVEVPAGGTLESEVLYLAVTESNALVGLERYGKAVAMVNRINHKPAFIPHGWDSWNTKYHSDINETIALENLNFVDRKLKRYGWTHFALDDGWQQGIGDWEANLERFPKGMKAFADEVHRRGMTSSLWLNPFAVDKNSALAREHPEWMLNPKPGLGRMIVGDKFIPDVTRPEVYAWVRDLARKITQDWGYDGIVEADFVYFLLLAEGHAQPGLTNLEVLERGMAALREGMGPDRVLTTMTPQPVNALVAECIRTGFDNRPIWKTPNLKDPWGGVDALTNTIRRFYAFPCQYRPDPDCAYFGHEDTYARWGVKDKFPAITRDQSIAWLTGAALCGGAVKIGDAFADLKPDEVDILRRILPVPPRPARPLDIFDEKSPRIWSLPLDTPAGPWLFVGLFNWETDAPVDIPLSAGLLSLDPKAYYTVFDFWAGRYQGTFHGELAVHVNPGSVRFFGLRLAEDKPMFVASDNHLLQGALDQHNIAWDNAAAALSGEFTAIADTPYTLWFAAPEKFTLIGAEVSCGTVETTRDGRAITLKFNSGTGGPAKWALKFK